jgi:anaerobic dimethyl sulfoxide reductase subunit B (iron-sulfur subunit)
MRALDYGEYEELVRKYGDTRDVAPLPNSEETYPSLVLTLHRDAKLNADEGYKTSLYVTDR